MKKTNKSPRYFGILVLLLVAANVLGQELRQAIQLDSSTAIAFRHRVETVSAPTAPPRSPTPSFLGARLRKLYDVVMTENGAETVLETIETHRFEKLKSGMDADFTLRVACLPVPSEVVYVYSTRSKYYVNTARRGPDGRFHKVSGEPIAQGLAWERAKFKTEDGILKLYIMGDSKGPRVFERQESGAFVLKPEETQKPPPL